MLLSILYSVIFLQLLHSLNAVLHSCEAISVSPENLAAEYGIHFGGTHQGRSLYIIDNDGVLKPEKDLASGEEREHVRQILTTLTKNENNIVWIVSGRGVDHVRDQYIGIPNLNFAGHLGAQVLKSGDRVKKSYFPEVIKQTQVMGEKLKKSFGSLCEIDVTSGSIIFKHKGSYDEAMLAKIKEAAEGEPYTFENYDNFAALTHNGCDKGKFVAKLLSQYNEPGLSVIALGDAKIDAPMFGELEAHSAEGGGKTLSVIVGNAKINADKRLENYRAVIKFFCELLNISYELRT